MKFISGWIIGWACLTIAGNALMAKDVFPSFEPKAFELTVPTNTPGCVPAPKNLAGTNYVYSLNGQRFAGPSAGHIQTTAEGFSGQTGESTPWETLTELLACYQKGATKENLSKIYDDKSTNYINSMFGDEAITSRFLSFGQSVENMQLVLGFKYLDGYIAYVKADLKGGRSLITPFYFVKVGPRYKASVLQVGPPNTDFTNVGIYLDHQLSLGAL